MTNAQISRRDNEKVLPAIDGIAFDALSIGGSRRAADAAWYECFALTPLRVVVAIGDVGSGSLAVATLTRTIREACSDPAAEPLVLLRAVEAAFRRRTAAPFSTATVGIIDLAEQTFTYVTAGHSPAFLRYSDGRVAALPADGLPIGVDEGEHPCAQIVVDLRDVTCLLLYSNGLIGAAQDIAAGLLRLRDVLASERMTHCGSPAAWVAQRMLGDCSHGDVALLALTFDARRGSVGAASDRPAGTLPSWSASWSFEATGPASAGARRAFMACLKSKESGLAVPDYSAAELIFGELLGNVVRHAPGPVEITLDWSADVPVLHVFDRGSGFRSRRSRERLPVDDWSESGRGLFIINACSTSFSVRNRPGGGTHASATLALV